MSARTWAFLAKTNSEGGASVDIASPLIGTQELMVTAIGSRSFPINSPLQLSCNLVVSYERQRNVDQTRQQSPLVYFSTDKANKVYSCTLPIWYECDYNKTTITFMVRDNKNKPISLSSLQVHFVLRRKIE